MDLFHPFRRLPPELRQRIYDLATLPRIVHIRERVELYQDDDTAPMQYVELQTTKDWDRVFANFKGYYNDLAKYRSAETHADVAYFIYNWVRSPFQQDDPKLLSEPQFMLLWEWQEELWHYYHAATEEDRRQKIPWVGTVQRLSSELAKYFHENPEVAIKVLRRSYLYSKAPIPPLLHTCKEARDFLVTVMGYQLAFGTRSYQALTWFNFKMDRLYLADKFFEWGSRIDGFFCEPWNASQFRSQDLERIERLTLGTPAVAEDDLMEMREAHRDAAGLVALMPRLRELELEE